MADSGYTGCLRGLREEFRIKKIGLGHEDPALFVKPQFFKPRVYVPWVVVWLLYYTAMLMLDVYYNQHEGPTWFIYLTNLSYLVQGVGVVADCAVTLHVHVNKKDIRDGDARETPWYIKVLWVVFNVSITSSILVTLLYYSLLSPDFSHGSVTKHLLNSVYTILLLFFSAKPVQLLHVYQPMIYLVLYAIFSVIYQEAGNDAIYDPLDWDKPGATIITVVLAIFLGAPAVHLFCFSLYTLRLFIWSKFNVRTEPISTSKGVTDKTIIAQESVAKDPIKHIS